MAGEIRVERDGGVATIVLDAPDRRNALTRDMARELVAACEAVDADADVGAVVVAGAGGFFCAGGDRDTLAAAGRDPAAPEAYTGLGDVYRSFARVGELEPPTIAAVRGGAVGAGVNLAFATDLRVVAREAKIVSGFLPIGLASRGRSRRAAGPHRPARGRCGAGALRRADRRRAGGRARTGVGGGRRQRGGGDGRGARGPRGRRPRAGRRTARSLAYRAGPAPLPWPAALELERASQMWSLRRRHLAGEAD